MFYSYLTRHIFYKNDRLMQFKQTIAEYFEDQLTQIDSLYGQNSFFISNFEAGGTYDTSCASKNCLVT